MNSDLIETSAAKFSQDDRESLIKLWSDPRVREFLGGPAAPERIERMLDYSLRGLRERARLDPDRADYTIRAGERLIGIITFAPHVDGSDIEVSYLLLPEWWGRNVMRVGMIDALTLYGESHDIPRVIAETQSANERSWRLLQNLGFELDREIFRHGADQLIYVLRMPIS